MVSSKFSFLAQFENNNDTAIKKKYAFYVFHVI